mmetsp:Transcript_61877/g.162540  ORF Transcript_61877/g.162540 Transcript_61877/m.162540 type:complete len:168 (-) Transcript_61877:304-807(-)
MKPDWDKLTAEFKDSKTVLIADVDCTAGGKALCEQHGVKGYPTIKFGDPNNLEDYKGGRKLADLISHASENLGPTCGPENPDLCSADKKKQLDEFMVMSGADLKAKIDEQEKAMAQTDIDMQELTKSLQSRHEASQKARDEKKAAIKEAGLGLMKSVYAHKKSKDEL